MKKAETNKQSFIERFCSAHEKKARISLILAAAVVVTMFGSVCTAAITINSGIEIPSENLELNAAEQYLAQAALESSQNADGGETLPEGTEEAVQSDKKSRKRGGLTGEHIIDFNDLKSLSDDDLVDAILSGKAGTIDKDKITIDNSQDTDNSHSGSGNEGGGSSATSTPTPTPSPVPAAGKITLPDPDPVLPSISCPSYELGIDVSGHNGDINWTKVKQAGITYAFIRCGGRGYGAAGNIYEDSKFNKNIQGAKAAGIKVGVYFFSQAITPYEALEEASIVLSKLNGMGLDLPVVMDWETEYDGEHRTEKLSGDDLYKCILSFCSTISQHGYTPMVYLDGGNINRLGGHLGDVLSKYKLWYAYPYAVYNPGSKSYVSNMYQAGDTIPSRSYKFEYWQYSWWGKISGISTDVDLNLRIIGSTTLYGPSITLANRYINSTVGDSINLMSGVSATSSQKGDATGKVTYEIKDAGGNVVSYDTAKSTAGEYLVTYTLTDSYRDTYRNYALWTVAPLPTETPTPTPVPTPETSSTPGEETSATSETSTETEPTQSETSEPTQTESPTETTQPDTSGNPPEEAA